MKKEITKEVFNSIDLRAQLTEELKNRWYYQQVKWGLRVNKKSVVFDDSFKFTLRFVDKEIAKETKDISYQGQNYHIEKGEVLSEAYIIVDLDGHPLRDPYTYDFLLVGEDNICDIDEILKKIVLYIAKYI